MFRSALVLVVLASLGGCESGLRGIDGFPVGRAQLVPCTDRGGEPGALLIVESRNECWVSLPGERPGCVDRSRILNDNPSYCSPNLVIDSPSQTNLDRKSVV